NIDHGGMNPLPILPAKHADQLHLNECAVSIENGDLGAGLHFAAAQLAEVMEVLAPVRLVDQGQQRGADQPGSFPAQQPRPGQVDVADAAVAVEGEKAHRSEVVEVRIILAGDLDFELGFLQGAPLVPDFRGGKETVRLPPPEQRLEVVMSIVAGAAVHFNPPPAWSKTRRTTCSLSSWIARRRASSLNARRPMWAKLCSTSKSVKLELFGRTSWSRVRNFGISHAPSPSE